MLSSYMTLLLSYDDLLSLLSSIHIHANLKNVYHSLLRSYLLIHISILFGCKICNFVTFYANIHRIIILSL